MIENNERVSLTPEQSAQIADALMTLNRLIPQLDDLEECGRDCKERRARLQKSARHLEKLLEKFGAK